MEDAEEFDDEDAAEGFNDQDAELGLDTYCIYLSWGRLHYGGVTKYTVEDRSLVLYLDEEAQHALGAREQLRLDLQVSEDDVATLRTALARILSGVAQ